MQRHSSIFVALLLSLVNNPTFDAAWLSTKGGAALVAEAEADATSENLADPEHYLGLHAQHLLNNLEGKEHHQGGVFLETAASINSEAEETDGAEAGAEDDAEEGTEGDADEPDMAVKEMDSLQDVKIPGFAQPVSTLEQGQTIKSTAASTNQVFNQYAQKPIGGDPRTWSPDSRPKPAPQYPPQVLQWCANPPCGNKFDPAEWVSQENPHSPLPKFAYVENEPVPSYAMQAPYLVHLQPPPPPPPKKEPLPLPVDDATIKTKKAQIRKLDLILMSKEKWVQRYEEWVNEAGASRDLMNMAIKDVNATARGLRDDLDVIKRTKEHLENQVKVHQLEVGLHTAKAELEMVQGLKKGTLSQQTGLLQTTAKLSSSITRLQDLEKEITSASS